MENINYGYISKRVMNDRNISVQAKCLYSFISAFSGTYFHADLSVSFIKTSLCISDTNTYLRYRKELEDNNLIVVQSQRNGGRASKNRFYINLNPGGITRINDTGEQITHFKAISNPGGLFEFGYGVLHQDAMSNNSISLIAKSILSYISCYKDNVPYCSDIMKNLAIANNTLFKYMKELKEKNLLKVNKIRSVGKFARNTYEVLIENFKKIFRKNQTVIKKEEEYNETQLAMIRLVEKTIIKMKFTYKFGRKEIKDLLKSFKNDFILLSRALSYVEINEPKNGYKTFIGALIKSKTYDEVSNRENE